MDDDAFLIVTVVIAILLAISIIGFGFYMSDKLSIENFQITIGDLSDEQKCIHICGFQFHGSAVFDNYKFCMEKCDRISERTLNQCKVVA